MQIAAHAEDDVEAVEEIVYVDCPFDTEPFLAEVREPSGRGQSCPEPVRLPAAHRPERIRDNPSDFRRNHSRGHSSRRWSC